MTTPDDVTGAHDAPSASVSGTPRWATTCAWATLACVLPACAWRSAVGLGVPLGWTREHLQLERIPGPGTAYVLGLSAATLATAALTLGLVQPWGERVPDRLPLLGGRRVPISLAATTAVLGAAIVLVLVCLSVVHWPSVSGFRDRPTSGWALVMIACYAPSALWPPLLLAVTAAYVRRRRRPGLSD